jgi:hypothetical protein
MGIALPALQNQTRMTYVFATFLASKPEPLSGWLCVLSRTTLKLSVHPKGPKHISCLRYAVASIYCQIRYGDTSLLLLLCNQSPSLLPKRLVVTSMGTAPLVQECNMLARWRLRLSFEITITRLTSVSFCAVKLVRIRKIAVVSRSRDLWAQIIDNQPRSSQVCVVRWLYYKTCLRLQHFSYKLNFFIFSPKCECQSDMKIAPVAPKVTAKQNYVSLSKHHIELSMFQRNRTSPLMRALPPERYRHEHCI